MNKVLTIGTFDLLHTGHINIFKKCRQIAGKNGMVTVGINTDDFISKYKGNNPAVPFLDRVIAIEATKYVDATFGYNGPIDNNVIRTHRPDFIVIGTDWARKDYFKQLGIPLEEFEELGISLVYTPYTKHISSTIIKDRICSQMK